MNVLDAILLSGLVCACGSCGRNAVPIRTDIEPAAGQILAVVGPEHVTAEEFRAELARRSGGFPEAYRTHDQRADLLDEMIRVKAALAKARASGQDREPATRALVEKLIASRYLEEEFTKWTTTNSPVGDTEIRTFYETHADQFRIPASVRAGVITFHVSSKAGTDERLKTRARAAAVRTQASTVDDSGFTRLVQQHSEDQSSRYTAGDTGWFPPDRLPAQWPATVLEAALALQHSGEVAPLVETTNGYFIVRLTGRRDDGVRPLAEVREALRYQIQQRRREQREQEFSAALKSGLDIHINRDVLESIPLPKPRLTSAPPVMPGG